MRERVRLIRFDRDELAGAATRRAPVARDVDGVAVVKGVPEGA
jgi:hypothetical protein